MVIDKNFWFNKRILITGHTGFKGSWLSLWLQSLGAQVIGYAHNPPTTPNLFDLAKVEEGIVSVIGDVRNFEALKKVFDEHKPEIVIHLAAQSLVKYSYNNPVETYSTNVMGTINLLEAVRQSQGIKVVLNVTSDKCYENREWIWGYREDEPMGGFDPYSNSKGCSELVTSAYRNSYFNPKLFASHGVALSSARAGNVIGGGDWADNRLIPDMLRAISKGNPVNIRSPNAIRPWQHVLEPLSGYLLLSQKMYESGAKYSGAWNFGPNDNDTRSVEWIANLLTDVWGQNASWKIDKEVHPHEAHYLKLDCTKAKTILNWEPKWSLTEAIHSICLWHKAYLKGDNIKSVCFKQIDDYQLMR
jgi:CDP-glucose 4,6-dehydratase